MIYVALLTLNWWERCCSRIFIANRFRFEAVRCRAAGQWGAVHAAGGCWRAPDAAQACAAAPLPACDFTFFHPADPRHALPARHPQERADDEHTTRGMRLVQAELDAMSKGWPLGDGIALFGLGSYVGGSTSAGAKRGSQADLSVELNASSSAAAGGASSSAAGGSRPPLFGGGGASSSEPGRGSPPSKAALMREKYGNRSSGSMAGSAAAASSAAPAPAPAPNRQQRREHEEAAVDALFAGVEARPSRQNARLLDEQHTDSAGGGYLSSWKGLRR